MTPPSSPPRRPPPRRYYPAPRPPGSSPASSPAQPGQPQRPPDTSPPPGYQPLQRPPVEPTPPRAYPSLPPAHPHTYVRLPPRRRRPALPRISLPPLPRPPFGLGCFLLIAIFTCFLLGAGAYMLYPGRITVLLMGVDYAEPGDTRSRTDTLILAAFDPWQPYAGLLSIPRDLWVNIPGVGQNRINTAHFYAENQQPGSGPSAVMQTVHLNFGIDAPYYVRIRFEGFREVIDALGGVDITLAEPTADYPAGRHHLTPRKALAFVRHRATSDDFHRMSNGQLMLKAIFLNLLNPLNWPRLPAVLHAISRNIDTNLPVSLWPRLAMALLRLGPKGIDSRVINRQLVTPFTTDQGAMVLAPNWDAINPVLKEMFIP